MMDIYVSTFNVLHRYHEENYCPNSTILAKYPKESDRINDSIKIIQHVLETYKENILCMQEVYGDLLTEVKKYFSQDFHILEFEYHRIPTKKKTSTNTYQNPKEYLVTLVSKKIQNSSPKIETVQFETFGKGALITILNDLIVVNTHLTIPEKDKGDLPHQIMKHIMNQYQLPFIVTGDFNRTIDKVIHELDQYKYKPTDYAHRTKLNKYTYPIKNEDIDQMLGFNVSFDYFDIIDTTLTSDHNLVLGHLVYKSTY
jgi:endonuclease/exonuclease/phosphatase family metal-dependent hydrolase